MEPSGGGDAATEPQRPAAAAAGAAGSGSGSGHQQQQGQGQDGAATAAAAVAPAAVGGGDDSGAGGEIGAWVCGCGVSGHAVGCYVWGVDRGQSSVGGGPVGSVSVRRPITHTTQLNPTNTNSGRQGGGAGPQAARPRVGGGPHPAGRPRRAGVGRLPRAAAGKGRFHSDVYMLYLRDCMDRAGGGRTTRQQSPSPLLPFPLPLPPTLTMTPNQPNNTTKVVVHPDKGFEFDAAFGPETGQARSRWCWCTILVIYIHMP